MSPGRRALVMTVATLAVAGCDSGVPPIAREAPEECGFPDGAALSLAVRSTMAAEGMAQTAGPVLAAEPAEIYVTRDTFMQGELRGQLVCTFYLESDFLEVTTWPLDGGVTPTPEPSSPVPSDGIGRQEAVDLALGEVEDGAAWEVVGAQAFHVADLFYTIGDQEWAADLSGDQWVWSVFLIRGDRGADVIIDYVDGTVYGVVETIVN